MNTIAESSRAETGNVREIFERVHPVPNTLEWSDERNRYVCIPVHVLRDEYDCHGGYQEKWEGFQSGRASVQPSEVAQVGEAVAWLIQYNDVREVFLHNCVADFRVYDRDATSTPLYVQPAPAAGWVAVPIELTDEMVDVWLKSRAAKKSTGEIWADLIAAAPPTAAPGEGL